MYARSATKIYPATMNSTIKEFAPAAGETKTAADVDRFDPRYPDFTSVLGDLPFVASKYFPLSLVSSLVLLFACVRVSANRVACRVRVQNGEWTPNCWCADSVRNGHEREDLIRHISVSSSAGDSSCSLGCFLCCLTGEYGVGRLLCC